MNKKYVVRLSDDERAVCQEIIKQRKGSSQQFRRAQRLLKAEAEGPGWPEVRMAAAFNCRAQTIAKLRQRLVTEGFAVALAGKKRRDPPTPGKRDGEAEAKVIARRRGQPNSVRHKFCREAKKFNLLATWGLETCKAASV